MSVAIFTANALSAQSVLRLINSDDMALSFAHYRYGEQTGTADEQGNIQLEQLAGTTLYISHVSYGKMQFSPDVLTKAFASGTLLIEREVQHLQPVTVIGIKQNYPEQEGLELTSQDLLDHDAGNFLTQTPTIAAIRKGGRYGFDPVMRGFKYEQLNIVIDGAQAMNAACPNRMDPPVSQISLNQMARVELLKGPHNLRFGTGLGGTINFISNRPEFSAAKPEVRGRFSSAYESNGDVLRSEGLIGLHGKSLILQLNGAWARGNDYKNGEGVAVPADFERSSFGANLQWQASAKQMLSLSVSKNTARDTEFPALPMDLRSDDTWLFNLKHEANLGGALEAQLNTTLYASLVDHVMDNLSKNLNPRMVNARTNAETNTFGGRSELQFNFAKSKLYTGLDFRQSQAEGTRFREMLMGPMAGNILQDNAWQNSQISQIGSFAEYRLSKGRSQFVLGARLDINQAQAFDLASEFVANSPDNDITQINPSVSLGWDQLLGKNWSLGLWLARAQRSASITERYINYFPVGLDPYELVGNPQLAPEVNYQTDFVLRYEQKSTQIRVNVFAAYLQDYITSFIRPDLNPRLPMAPGVRQFVNVGEALLSGAEFSWQQDLPLGLQGEIQIAYTYGENLESAEALPEIAPLDMRSTLRANFLQDKLQANLTWRHVWEQNRISQEFGENPSPGFALVDLGLNYHLNATWHFAAGVQNIFDTNYYEHLNRAVRAAETNPIFAPGRNFYANMRLNF